MLHKGNGSITPRRWRKAARPNRKKRGKQCRPQGRGRTTTLFCHLVSLACLRTWWEPYGRTRVCFYHLLDLVVSWHCLLIINWLFCTKHCLLCWWPHRRCLFSIITAWPTLRSSWHCSCSCLLLARLFSCLLLALLLLLPAVGTALFLPAVGTALFFMGPRVPSLAVFSSPSRPSVLCSSVHISRRWLRSGYCFVPPARAAYFFFCLFPGWLILCLPFSPHTLRLSGYFSVLLARVADFIFFFFRADSSFPALVGFFWPDCDFQSSMSSSRHSRAASWRHFLSFGSSSSILW